MEPMADNARTLLPFGGPVLEAEVCKLVGFDTKCVDDNSGGAISVVAVNCLLEKISVRSDSRLPRVLPIHLAP